ncbi:hypothetical protein [Variovorax sp. GB1P17]|uniref:hypothetical protein n=1 Tax=Variovorax sp. GB1P17 TaxID=3443740 RepID=UPI003F4666F0
MHSPLVSSSVLSRTLLAGAIAVLFGVAGCSQEEDSSASSATTAEDVAATATTETAPAPTNSATLKRGELMALVFPGWEDKDDSRGGAVQLPDIGNDGKPVKGSEAEQQANVSPREVVRLDDTHAVMLTETVPLDDQGQPISSHVAGAWLGAYFFEQGADGWTLAKRSDGVDYLGFMGNIGQTRVERIAPQRFVLTTTSGSCWQGNCGTWFSVYELGASTVHELVTSIPLSATNSGADEACEQVLQNKRPETPARGNCFDVDGTPEFVLGTDDEPGDMRIVFSGAQTTGTSNRAQTVDRTVVYTYRKGTYVPGEGRNPVPGF